MDTLASYDELPYASLPLPETQPDVLAAIAKLHGFDAPDPTRARILELGCAQGGNLIPLAARWPHAQCVGVELSRVQADAGARFVEALELANVRIVHGDLAALPDDLGEFDYIIAHGVYSWVPPLVQAALLDVCRRHLSPHGLAYISFNVAAGWARLAPLREALVARTDATLPAPARYQQALRVLDALEAEWRDPALLKEIAFLKTAAPSYLFHEYLAEFNAPLTFDAFAQRIDEHDLRYVGEAGPRHAVVALEDAWGLAPEGMVGRWLDAEAALDETQAIRFRRALVARADAPCAQPPQAEALRGLAYYADLRCDDELDLASDTEQRFVNPAGHGFPVDAPLMKAALMVLSASYPNAVSGDDLFAASHGLVAEYGTTPAPDAAAFVDALFGLVVAHIAMPTIGRESYVAEPGERPRASALARMQARAPGWVVSGARHVAIDLDAPGRTLLALLDGTRDFEALVTCMHAALSSIGQDLTREQVAEMTYRQLWLFARQGVLVA